MPRRRVVAKREVLPDPKYGSKILAKFMHLTYFVRYACVIQYSLSRRGFSRIDVGNNAYIAISA